MSDQQSGLLLLAQFSGATTGGLTVSKRLNRSLTLGLAAAAIGFLGFAIASGLPFACISLFAAGWGVGQLITAGNITAGRRYAGHRGSALALLNFSFSLGAMLSPLLAAWLTPHFALRTLLSGFAACFAAVFAALLFELRNRSGQELPASTIPRGESQLTLRVYLYFAFLLFLYGGVETSLDGWLTTFALRYGERTLAIGQYTTLILWASLTTGRALSSLLLLRIAEANLQRAALVLTTTCIAALAVAHGALAIVLLACLLGLSLAPFFPSTFALLMADKPSARQAGVVLAMSGLGAAFLPALMGVISTRSGSLQVALAIPLATAAVLLTFSLFPPSKPHPATA
jgi:fucose permease